MAEVFTEYKSEIETAKKDPILNDILSRFNFSGDRVQFDNITLNETMRVNEKWRDSQKYKDILETLIQVYLLKAITRLRLSSQFDDVKIFWHTQTRGLKGLPYQLWNIIGNRGGLEVQSSLNNTVLMSHDLLANIFEWAKWQSGEQFEVVTTKMSLNLANFLNQVLEKVFNPNKSLQAAKK